MTTYQAWIDQGGSVRIELIEATSERAAYREATASLAPGEVMRGVIEDGPAVAAYVPEDRR